MLQIIKVNINGREQEIAVDIRWSLAEMLRKQGFTSVKTGCQVGECGSCTVLVDGQAIDSCMYLAIWAEGKNIITVEGLRAGDGELHPIQKAFVEEAAIQCGFCTPGMIMRAVEIVGSDRAYTREELRREISGNLCRCTGYENIINAMEKAIAAKAAEQK